MDNIESNFDKAQDYVKEAKSQLVIAQRYATKARKVRCEQNFSTSLLYLCTKSTEIEHKSIFSFRPFFFTLSALVKIEMINLQEHARRFFPGKNETNLED